MFGHALHNVQIVFGIRSSIYVIKILIYGVQLTYTLEKYISNSGDVWDLVVYQDTVYLSLMTTIGAVVYQLSLIHI